MVKYIIQIPCYNEEKMLGVTLSLMSRKVPGIDVVEWLVINDGSTYLTVDVAKEHGVEHIVTHSKNLCLARAT